MANEKSIFNEQHSLKNFDVSIQVTNMLGAVFLLGKDQLFIYPSFRQSTRKPKAWTSCFR